MSAFYILPYNALIALIMLLSFILIMQISYLSYGFFSFRFNRKKIALWVLELAMLVQQFVILCCTAETVYQYGEGYSAVNSYSAVRYTLFFVLLLLGILVCLQEKEIMALIIPAAASVTLPAAENATGKYFLVLFAVYICFWLLYTVNRLILYHRELREKLSVFSIKEAIDTMPSGILLCRADGVSDGQILLSNRKMQELNFIMTGKLLYNGKEFYKKLISGDVNKDCTVSRLSPNPVYIFPDSCVWRFSLKYIKIKNRKCAMLIASDMTESKKISDQLYEQNRELAESNIKLKDMLANIESICRTEEMLQAKSRIHDVLGQRISIILRSVREHKEPDEKLLRSFACGFPDELKNASINPNASLKVILDSFKALGITVNINGELPARQDIQKAFLEIITESITNAVRHGYATEITVKLDKENDFYKLFITDNGISKKGPVTEGGGLNGIRRKIETFGGTFSYEHTPHFSISVKVPNGGIQ